jgi:hypothetical protein
VRLLERLAGVLAGVLQPLVVRLRLRPACWVAAAGVTCLVAAARAAYEPVWMRGEVWEPGDGDVLPPPGPLLGLGERLARRRAAAAASATAASLEALVAAAVAASAAMTSSRVVALLRVRGVVVPERSLAADMLERRSPLLARSQLSAGPSTSRDSSANAVSHALGALACSRNDDGAAVCQRVHETGAVSTGLRARAAAARRSLTRLSQLRGSSTVACASLSLSAAAAAASTPSARPVMLRRCAAPPALRLARALATATFAAALPCAVCSFSATARHAASMTSSSTAQTSMARRGVSAGLDVAVGEVGVGLYLGIFEGDAAAAAACPSYGMAAVSWLLGELAGWLAGACDARRARDAAARCRFGTPSRRCLAELELSVTARHGSH